MNGIIKSPENHNRPAIMARYKQKQTIFRHAPMTVARMCSYAGLSNSNSYYCHSMILALP